MGESGELDETGGTGRGAAAGGSRAGGRGPTDGRGAAGRTGRYVQAAPWVPMSAT